MKVYVTFKAWNKTIAEMFYDSTKIGCRLFSVHPTISEMESLLPTAYVVYTIYKK